MQLCNNAVPTDCNEIVLDQVVLNNRSYEIINRSQKYDETKDAQKQKNAIGQTIETDFAPALYLQMDNEEKLNSPSYVKQPCGFAMRNNSERKMGNTNECDLGAYEVFIRNGNGSQKSSVAVASSSTGKRVAYQKKDKVAVQRYVSILDTIQS